MEMKRSDWNLPTYTIAKAKSDFESLQVQDKKVTPINVSGVWADLRKELIQARDEVFDNNHFDPADKLGYKFDIEFGFKLHKILCEEIGFNNRVASDNGIWRYLSIKVIPDIVHSRHGMEEDYFYKKPRRVWLSVIWWYIYLSWTENEERTREIIENNTTDTIMNLVERPGLGYYVDVYREIMRQYQMHNDSDRGLFRRVLKLNTARLLTVTPELIPGGIEAYVKELFDTAIIQNDTNY